MDNNADSESGASGAEPERAFDRVSNWISKHDFRHEEDPPVETNLVDGITDITSVTKNIERNRRKTCCNDGLVVEERTDVVKCGDGAPDPEDPNLIKALTKFSQYSPFEKRRTRTASPTHFSVIVEGEELELPETKRSDTSFKSLKQAVQQHQQQQEYQPPRPSSRHKRHADAMMLARPGLTEKKTRKRRTLEKLGASVMFRKFLNAFLESTLVGAILLVLDLLLNSSQIPSESSSYFYF